MGTYRSKFTGVYTGSSLAFPDASHLYTLDVDTGEGEFYRWTVDSSGISPIDSSTLSGFGAYGAGFKLQNSLVYAVQGGLADPRPTPPQQLAQYQVSQILGSNQSVQAVNVAPDSALDRVFFLAGNSFGSNPVLASFDQARYEPLAYFQFPQNNPGPDLVRWG
jgi:trimeric autotransporter adhesin